MRHVIYMDRGDHYEVIADYALSPRHAALNEADWIFEFKESPSYEDMRKTHPSAIAGIMSCGIGKWEKDWSKAYRPPSLKLSIISDAPLDFDGTPSIEAGSGKQRLTIKKTDQNGNDVKVGSEPIRILVSWPIHLSSANPSLENGHTTIEVGPSDAPCDLVVSAADPAGNLKKGSLTVRFK